MRRPATTGAPGAARAARHGWRRPVPGTGHYVSMRRPLTAAAALRRRPGVPAVLAGLAAMALGLSACSGSGAVSGGSGGGGGGGTPQPSAPSNPGGLVQPAGKISWHTCPEVPAPAPGAAPPLP